MKKLPLGVQTFRDIIEGDYLYIDKTKDIYNFFTDDGKYYFLSRPRRFGKSLLVSTLKELFLGNKELFKDLWICDKIQWLPYSVINIDFTKISYDSPQALEKSLVATIRHIAQQHQITLEKEADYKYLFGQLIETLAKTNKVVLLIDEYDKPIVDKLNQKKVAIGNRDVLREFYAVIKATDEYNHFAFITGVSKFSKVSVFSGLNNLTDITIDDTFSTILGCTHDELLHYFHQRLEQVVGDGDREEWLKHIKAWYNGYSWDGKNFIYNPYSLLHFFRKKRFGNYWFESGSPSFLIEAISKYKVDIPQLENYKAGAAIFSAFGIEKMHVVALLFQTGYLTVKEIIEPSPMQKSMYVLSYPNQEVKESFMEYLLADYSTQFADQISVVVAQLKSSLKSGDCEAFFKAISAVFAGIDYNMFVREREGYYQTVIYLLLKLIGLEIQAEMQTNQGRIDAAIETDDFIYVMEFKLGAAKDAMAQIKKKKYYEKYQAATKIIKLVGVGFDAEKRNIGDYLIEEIKR
ncbi:MAG: AAA family ATPase [bacterium]|nr:AAA family ATPase [bacterium]